MDYIGFMLGCRISRKGGDWIEEEEEGREGEECLSARGGLYAWQAAIRWIRTAIDG